MTRLGTLAASPITDALSRQFDEIFDTAGAKAEAAKITRPEPPRAHQRPQDDPMSIAYAPKREHRPQSAAHITSQRQFNRSKR